MKKTSNKIFYFGSFDTLRDKHGLKVSPACCNKMEYVAEALTEIGCECEIVSIAKSNIKGLGIQRSNKSKLGAINVFFFSSITGSNPITEIIQRIWRKFQLVFFFLFRVRSCSTIVLYHTTRHIELFYLMKLIFRPRLILEVEEVYDKVSKVDKLHGWLEKKIFDLADAYIFPTEILNEQVNTNHKPFAIVYGSYKLPTKVSSKNDDRIHVVYSGTFNPRKGGAIAAIEASEFLDFHYHLHITGWGTEKETAVVKKMAEETAKKTECAISFDGFIEEGEFPGYLQKFHVGICSQNPNDILSSFCFPSKILVYMGNGLSVVSSHTVVIDSCSISDKICTYEEQTGKAIAMAVQSVAINNSNRDAVSKLHKSCIKSLNQLLS